ncbi:MAG: ABC transporter ATP-binding protein [Candidatus Vogelbacteria bacterium]|nr:ABC transporter ATP-binding protein [Candidatus Vogelbacteria bacterium]
MKEILLQLNNAQVNFGGVRALDDVSVEIDEGEIVAVLGPNGAGKSTVLKAIFGLVPLDRGEIRWHGEIIESGPRAMVGRGLAFVPQGRRVFTHLTVRENLEVGGFVVRDERLINQRIEEALGLFPALRPKLAVKAGRLSGGQQQMLAIARGLMTDPKALLLDEPSLGLAPFVVKEVFKLIHEINERRRTAIMIVEHNIKSLLDIAHRAYALERGRVAFVGSSPELLRGPILERVLLGATIAA